MLRGLTVSTLIHASVLAMAVLSWPEPRSECDREIERLRREQPGISSMEILMRLPQCASSSELPIDFLEIGRISDLADLRRAETPPPEPEPAPPPPEPETPPPPAPQAPPPEPEPEVVVPDPREPPPEPEPKPEPKPPEPRPEPRPQPRPRPPEPQPKNDLDFLDDFDSALRTRQQQTPARQSPQTNEQSTARADRDRVGAGDRRGATASLQAALRRQIGECWVGVDDLPPEHQIDVVVRVKLARDGSLAESVSVTSPRSRPVGRSGIAWDRALLAVRKCAEIGNYRLPAEDYDLWKDIEVTLGPRQG